MNFRIGHGYDVHTLMEKRRLILGGVHVSHDLGLLGHSDADVLIHAIIDSIIGALGLGDLGHLFPDTDDKYLNISSLVLLQEVYKKMNDLGYKVSNIDSTIIAQKPKLYKFIPQMKQNISSVLLCDNINIKATTEEYLGFTGKSEGIASHAVCLLSSDV